MQDEFATKQLDPVSRVVTLVDTNGDGIMDKRTVFIDNVVLPRTVLPLHDRGDNKDAGKERLGFYRELLKN